MSRTGERIIALLAASIFPVLSVRAQCQVKGIVKGMDGKVLQGVTLRLLPDTSERILAFGFSARDGRFRLNFEPSHGIRYRLVAAGLNLHSDTSVIAPLHPGMDSLPNPLEIMLSPAPSNLEEVVVRSPAMPFKSKGDTLEYDASRFRTAQTSKLEHLLQNMYGFDLGPDGRIRYNGREIDRILIEGEDIAERDYRLISRNLGAALVEKVQVLSDFSEDRLMKEVGRSGRIGINLTIDSSHRGRPTGSVEAGGGTGGREWLDNSAIRVGDLLKSMAFMKYNETGEPSGWDADHHFEDSRPEDSRTTAGLQENVATGLVPLPPLENTYIRDNRDLGSHVMANAKSGNGFRYKALFGLDKSGLRNEAWSEEAHYLPDGRSWTMQQRIRSRSQSLGVTGRIGIDYDRGRRQTGRWRLILNGGNSRDDYGDLASGAIADTLSETLNSTRSRVGFEGEHAVRLPGGRVLKGKLSFDRHLLHQGFLVHTGRLSGLFQSDSSQNRFWQELDATGNTAEASLVLHGRGKSTDWRMGWRLQLMDLMQRSKGWTLAEGVAMLQDPSLSNSDLNMCRVEAFASLERRLSEKTGMSASLQAGFGAMTHILDGRANATGFPLHSLSVSLNRRLSILRFLNIELSTSSLMQSAGFFHPSALLTGEATVRWPAEAPTPMQRHSIRLRHISNSLSKGREFMFGGSFVRSDGAYSLSYERTPSLLIAFPLAMPASNLIDVQARFQKYVVGLKTKTGVSGGAMLMQERLLYNSTPGLHRTAQMHARWHAVTAFQGKTDFEASLMAAWISDRLLPETGFVSGFTQWNFQGHLKCRIGWTEKLFTAVMGRFYLLDRSRVMHAIDMHASFTATPKWRFTLIGHNLLDVKTLSQRMPGLGSLSERNTALVGRYVQLRVALDF